MPNKTYFNGPMKSKLAISCLLLMASTMVFKASNHAPIEKPPCEVSISKACFMDDHQMVYVYQASDLTVSVETLTLPKLDPGVLATTYGFAPVSAHCFRWRPFGPINTKYHSPWLFEPVKIC